MSAASLRARLIASRSADGDTIELFGTILEAAGDLRRAGEAIDFGTRNQERPSDRTLAAARAAIKRASDALDDYEAGR